MTGASSWSVALSGLDGQLVEVEAALGAGLPRVVLVGLPDTALYEARDRCKAAVNHIGAQWPDQLVTINLTPANLPKAGSHYDLAIVAAVLATKQVVPVERTQQVVLMGELGLDGRVRRVRGILPGLLAAVEAGFDIAVVPAEQIGEARLVEGLTVWGVATLADLIEVLNGRPVLIPEPPRVERSADRVSLDMADVMLQDDAKFVLEVAAAGRHHLLMHGAPGVGKTMLAERLPGILPDLTAAESLEVSAVHSMAGRDLNDGLITRPPYSDPHHNVSMAALIGGGPRVARPGAISLAHRGILFLDEAPEFGPRLLEALRTPLESGAVVIGRSERQARFPARFQLVLAANPCPCGQAGTPGGGCHCPPMTIRRYAERLSGPILDRVDLRHHLLPIRQAYLKAACRSGDTTHQIADRVMAARARQAARLNGTPWTTNGEVPGSFLRNELPAPGGLELLDDALLRGRLSSRGVDKVIRVAWTLADLSGSDLVESGHVRAAMALRGHDGEGMAA